MCSRAHEQTQHTKRCRRGPPNHNADAHTRTANACASIIVTSAAVRSQDTEIYVRLLGGDGVSTFPFRLAADPTAPPPLNPLSSVHRLSYMPARGQAQAMGRPTWWPHRPAAAAE